MPKTRRTVIELRAGPLSEAEVAIMGLSGEEALSRPYRFDVRFRLRTGEPADLAALAGTDAVLVLRHEGGAERCVGGVIAVAELSGVAAGAPQYRVRIVPRLALLACAADSRIFQDRTVPQVVKAVLDEAGVKHRFELASSHEARPYCVQYRETDLAFIERLLAEEGIFYWFEEGEDGELVLSDAVSRCPAIAGDRVVPYRAATGAASHDEGDHVFALAAIREVRPGRVALRDFDFERPELDLTGQAKHDGALELYEYPAGYVDPALGKKLARTRLEEARAGAEVCHGRSVCVRLVPGATFELEDAPEDGPREGLLVTRVDHEARPAEFAGEGSIEHVYSNRFTSQPASAPYRPARGAPRRVRGVHTATVVGPTCEEIHPDAHGRVKVQFHWDREGKRDERASCWLRVAQRWAGAAQGAIYLPRVGQEVVVAFLEGDPDRPIVTGAVYNGDNRPPARLPDEKTQSALRSDSSPACGGYNELRFEDSGGAEQVSLHAQRDERVDVGNDAREVVAGKELLEVAGDRTQTVRGHQELRVDGGDTAAIGLNRTASVARDRTTATSGSHRERIGGVQQVTVARARHTAVAVESTTTVGAAAALSVGGGYAVTVGGAHNVLVGGARLAQTGGVRVEVVGAAREERVGGDAESRVGRDLAVEVKAGASIETGGDHVEDVGGKAELAMGGALEWLAHAATLEADELTIVVGGKRVLEMKRSGEIAIAGANVAIDSD